MAKLHQPVLLTESLQYLITAANGVYIDGTFGRGGHAQQILRQLDEKSQLIAFDKDPVAIECAQQLAQTDRRVKVFHGSFADILATVQTLNLVGKIQGILLDLGVSSPQLDDPQRGFSFLRDGPLDMRMDPSVGESAAEWLREVSQEQLTQVLKDYGEERFARRIAAAIIRERNDNAIVTTGHLADIVAKANPAWEKRIHPATRSFQAIRIAVNHELDELKQCLPQCLEVLAVSGRLVVISFHSLEDRIVKRFMNEQCKGDRYPAKLPVTQAELNPTLKKIASVIRASADEVKDNPRARSAVLRIVEKLA